MRPLTNNALRCGALVMSLACAPIKAEIDSHLYSFDHVEHIVHDGPILEGMQSQFLSANGNTTL